MGRNQYLSYYKYFLSLPLTPSLPSIQFICSPIINGYLTSLDLNTLGNLSTHNIMMNISRYFYTWLLYSTEFEVRFSGNSNLTDTYIFNILVVTRFKDKTIVEFGEETNRGFALSLVNSLKKLPLINYSDVKESGTSYILYVDLNFDTIITLKEPIFLQNYYIFTNSDPTPTLNFDIFYQRLDFVHSLIVLWFVKLLILKNIWVFLLIFLLNFSFTAIVLGNFLKIWQKLLLVSFLESLLLLSFFNYYTIIFYLGCSLFYLKDFPIQLAGSYYLYTLYLYFLKRGGCLRVNRSWISNRLITIELTFYVNVSLQDCFNFKYWTKLPVLLGSLYKNMNTLYVGLIRLD